MARLAKRVCVVLGAALLLFVAWLGAAWPPPLWYRTHWPRQTAFMAMRARDYARAGSVPPFQYRPVPADDMTVWLGRAATVAEDDAFYQHHGIDWHALRDALGYRYPDFRWTSARDRAELRRALGTAAAHRDRLRGASTITQQLAKNLYLNPSRNPLRKLKEAVLAYEIEWSMSKSRILELYLNVVEMGPNLWGVEAAGRRYFGRSAAQLTLDQAATLIAVLPHPLTSNPAHRPGRTEARAQLILRRLNGENVVVPQEAPEDTVTLDSVPPAPVLPTLPAGSLKTAPPMPRNDSAAVPLIPDTTAVPTTPKQTPTPR